MTGSDSEPRSSPGIPNQAFWWTLTFESYQKWTTLWGNDRRPNKNGRFRCQTRRSKNKRLIELQWTVLTHDSKLTVLWMKVDDTVVKNEQSERTEFRLTPSTSAKVHFRPFTLSVHCGPSGKLRGPDLEHGPWTGIIYLVRSTLDQLLTWWTGYRSFNR